MAVGGSRNGWYDSGKDISPGEKCWNCNSSRYRQTVSTEDCPDCGIHFDYWSGGGGNDKYEQASREIHQRREREREERFRKQMEEDWENLETFYSDY